MRNTCCSLTVTALLLCAAMLTFAGKVKQADPRGDDAAAAEVAIKDFNFVPKPIKVKAGTKVTWTNQDEEPHKIAADDETFVSPALDTDEKYTHQFTTPGTYKYYCTVHPKMTGTIEVE